jgi:hypothetical protein
MKDLKLQKIKNWAKCVQNGEEYRRVVEKVKTLKKRSCSCRALNGKLNIIKGFEKGEVRYALCREQIWRIMRIDPHILDLGTSWICVVNFTPWLLYS